MQVGWLSEAYRLAKKKGHWLPAVEHRRAVPPTEIGSFSYDFSKSNLQTAALDSDNVVDHVQFQVCSYQGVKGSAIWVRAKIACDRGKEVSICSMYARLWPAYTLTTSSHLYLL